MGRSFRFSKYPYEEDLKVFEKSGVTFEPGITVLIGCNGAGKSTLLNILRASLNKKQIPVLYLDTAKKAQNAIESAIWDNNISLAAQHFSASEGERMHLCIGTFASSVRNFIRTGIPERSRSEIFLNEETVPENKERWILIDSADSGLSIDALQEVKDFLGLIIEDSAKSGFETYIVVSTNQYELAAGMRCLNVQTLTPVSVKSYNKYRSLILKSRERKEKR